MASLIKKAMDTWKYEGVMAVCRKTKNFLLKKKLPEVMPSQPRPSQPIYHFYKFILGRSVRGEELQGDPMPHTIDWILPDLGAPGGGGHLNIFRCIKYLEQHGYHNRIYFFNRDGIDTRAQVFNLYERHYRNVAGEDAEIFSVHCDPLEPAEVLFATCWETAYLVRDTHNCLHKFYFIQDFEPDFFAKGSEYWFAENTYKMGLIGVAASPWLKNKLEKEYGMKCYTFGFSFTKEVCYPRNVEKKGRQVFLYARPSSPRRMFELAILALALVSERMPDVRFVLAGASNIKSTYDIPFEFEEPGIMAYADLPAVYSATDIVVALSGTNVSLLPLEAMSSGAVVLTNDDEQVRWMLNEKNAILARMDPVDIAEKICDHLNHPEKLARLRKAGYEFAQKTSWEEEHEKVLKAIETELA